MDTIFAILLGLIVVVLLSIRREIVRFNNNFARVVHAAQAKEDVWTNQKLRQN